MDMRKAAEKEKREIIEYMLNNTVIEEKVQSWKQQIQNPVLIKELLELLAERAVDDGGLIVSVKSNEISAGEKNIEIFAADKKGDINIIEGKGKLRLAMAFTSRERFKKCNETAGFVMFIDDLFAFLENSPDIEGMILNFGAENAVIDKEMMRAVLEIIKEQKQEEE